MGHPCARAPIFSRSDVLGRIYAAPTAHRTVPLASREILREATRLAEARQLTPLIDPRRFDLHSTELAYEALMNGTARGKIVVENKLEDRRDLRAMRAASEFASLAAGRAPLSPRTRQCERNVQQG